MRIPIRLSSALALALLALCSQAHAQSGFDRRGGDYLHFEVRNGDPAACATRCERDARCHAWSFSYPRTENVVAVCWLKNKVPPRVEDKCCVSGVRGAGVSEPRKGPIEFAIDRFGGDYRNLEVAADASLARRLARQTTSAAPGPMHGQAMSGRQRDAISKTRLRGRDTSRAVSPASSDSCV
jgi:hypothetical protein